MFDTFRANRRLARAHRAHNRDVDKLADLDDEQLRYLADADQIPDPYTDGLECDHHEGLG